MPSATPENHVSDTTTKQQVDENTIKQSFASNRSLHCMDVFLGLDPGIHQMYINNKILYYFCMLVSSTPKYGNVHPAVPQTYNLPVFIMEQTDSAPTFSPM
jgi:hypothetical protein